MRNILEKMEFERILQTLKFIQGQHMVIQVDLKR
jgi:hypothetical protein